MFEGFEMRVRSFFLFILFFYVRRSLKMASFAVSGKSEILIHNGVLTARNSRRLQW